jgi:hypothetical protein
MKKIRAKKFIPGLFSTCYRKQSSGTIKRTNRSKTRKLRR